MWKRGDSLSAIRMISVLSVLAHTGRADDYQANYLYLGDDPSQETAWTYSARGLAHDSEYWYITQDDVIWRWPLTVELWLPPSNPGVARRPLSEYAELNLSGMEQLGDPCVYRYAGVNYLLMPLGDASGGADVITLAVFECPSLSYIDHAALPAGNAQWWFGVDENGNVYSSEEDAASVRILYRYAVDWARLRQTGTLSVGNPVSIALFGEDGVTPAALGPIVRGGEFTPDGSLLYLVSDRIHVFETSSWRRVQQSVNGSGYFNYEF